MTEKYRLMARQWGQSTNVFRCLLLRDPTPNLEASPQPISEDEGQPLRHWLHGLNTRVVFSNVNLVGLSRVEITQSAERRGELNFTVAQGSDAFDNLELFASLQVLSQPPGVAEDDPTILELKKEVDSMVKVFCCTQNLPAEGNQPTRESALIGPATLIQAYLDDRPLQELAELGVGDSGQLGALSLAVLSGYVFEVSQRPEKMQAYESVQVEFNGEAADLELVVQDDRPNPAELSLAVDQEPEGMYLRVDWRLTTTDLPQALRRWPEWTKKGSLSLQGGASESDRLRALNMLSDHTLVVKRSVGEAPVFASAALARSPLLVCRTQQLDSTGNQGGEAPRYIYVDRLEPTQFVGLLVHYLIEVRNPLDQIVASGQLSTRRWRLDPPPMPVDARACLKVGLSAPELSQALRIDVVLPSGEEALEPVVWYQSRPLDACGLFGTDDDMALEEGLRQADLNFEEDADLQNPRDWEGHPVARYLRGAYDKYGLKPIDSGFSTLRGTDLLNRMMEEGDAPSDAEKTRILEGEFIRLVFQDRSALDELCPENVAGARFYVALRRHTESSLLRNDLRVESVLRPSEHYIQVASGAPQRIFQIETIPPPSSGRTFLSAADITLHCVHGGKVDPDVNQLAWRSQNTGAGGQTSGIESGEPFEVRVRFPGRSGSAAPRPGGFRIWVRDVLGTQKPPFELASAFEALPPVVYRYRPYAMDSSRSLAPFDAPREGQVLGALPELPQPDGAHPELAETFFAAFSQALRLLPGAPRLVRAVAEVEQAQNGNHGQGEVGLNPSSEVQQAISRTLLTPAIIEKTAFDSILKELASNDSEPLRLIRNAVASELQKGADQQLEWPTRMLTQWALLAPYVDWAFAHGYARDVILPLGVRDASDLGAAISGPINDVENVIQALQKTAESAQLGCFALVLALPETRSTVASEEDPRILATVRVCVVPPREDLGFGGDAASPYAYLLHQTFRILASKVKVLYREMDPNPSLRPFDDAGFCTVDWAGLNDGWRHQLEFAVEIMDRYALFRALFQDQKDGDSSQANGFANSATPPDDGSPVQCLVVPRLIQEPPPPVVRSVADTNRVAFRIAEDAQRRAASHNLLMRVRSGPITRVVQLEYKLPWLERFTNFGFKLAQQEESSESMPPPLGLDALKNATTPSASSDEDEMEVTAPLFFVRYRLKVRHRADRIEDRSKSSSAEGQCLPRVTTIGVAERSPVQLRSISHSEQVWELRIPLYQLNDFLLDDERTATHRHYSAIRDMLEWPDLDTSYTLLDRDTSGSGHLVPLLTIKLPGYEGDTSEQIERPLLMGESLKNAQIGDPEVKIMDKFIQIQLSGIDWSQRQLIILSTRGDISSKREVQSVDNNG